MPGLQRIILINTHMQGVVELELDGHANVCGTNASGKTTLQRLVPVFYGELPGKVVPKTRKKFAEFYLPSANSYLIYEYQRPDGSKCQAVVTRKDNDSVQYRFVQAPFAYEQLLVENEQGKVLALAPDHWLRQLKQLGIEHSHKLQSTSEYRSVIQNDANVGRANSRENTKLRQLAAVYSLVAPSQRIRHMEKLVSAVHAKEGKMDTLRTMLAAIFEEDGLVQPSTTVKNTKAREWISQMRQTMALKSLHQGFEKISQQVTALNDTEALLLQLKPVLEADYQQLKLDKADAEEKLNAIKAKLRDGKERFEIQESELNSQHSEADSELSATSNRLDVLQNQYDSYLDSDMDKLEKDTQALPLWREQLEQQQEHYQLLIEQHQDMQSKLEQQKNKLHESLDRLRQKNQSAIKGLDQQKEQIRQQQRDKESDLRHDYEQRREQQQQHFEEAIQNLKQQELEHEFQVKNPLLDDSERENLDIADKRVELAQRQWQQAADDKTQADKQHQQSRRERDQADEALHQCRRSTRQATEQLQQLNQQLKPEQGSLRQFLRDNVEGWEHSIGKVIHAPLLERKDLSPAVNAASDSLMGVSVDTALIDAPEYAQEESVLRERLQAAEQHQADCQQQQESAEQLLDERHQLCEQLARVLTEKTRLFEQANNELSYAKDARQRVQQQNNTLLKERKSQAQQALSSVQAQLQQQRQAKAEALSQLKSDFDEQLLEFRAGWQEEIAILDEQIAELESQVETKREQNREQIKQLETAFNQELASKDIDPNTLKQLKSGIEQLQKDITSVSGRRDELREYQSFMQADWQKLRPQLLEQETTLKAQVQQLKQRLQELKQKHINDKAELGRQLSAEEQNWRHSGGLLTELQPLVKQLGQLPLSFVDTPAQINLGDNQERISRCNEALESRNREERRLKELLNQFESELGKGAGKEFLDIMQQSFSGLDEFSDSREKLPVLENLLRILDSKAQVIIEQGETIGDDLNKFFTVFSDINRKIASQSKRLTDEVADDLSLDGIARSEVKILSTVDELNFWTPLKRFADEWKQWRSSGDEMPNDAYLDSLADVVEVLPNDASYNIESLLRLELHLNEGGSDLVIKNDRQLLESSSHGMAYLILCKFLLTFTRLLRNQADIHIHWPIDEIGTLAYHNVEKLFAACDANHINILGAFPNPESEVLMLFKHRYLIDKQRRELQRIEPKLSRIAERLKQAREVA